MVEDSTLQIVAFVVVAAMVLALLVAGLLVGLVACSPSKRLVKSQPGEETAKVAKAGGPIVV